MPLKHRTRRAIVATTVTAVALIVAGLAFVSYFMHSVYEVEKQLDAEQLPAAVRTTFEARYPGAEDATWKFDEDLYEAEFAWRGAEDAEAYFAEDGTWMKSEFPTTLADLPEKARVYLASQKGYKVNDIERVEEAGSEAAYEVELASRLSEFDCLFDAEGNLLSRIRDGTPLEEEPEP